MKKEKIAQTLNNYFTTVSADRKLKEQEWIQNIRQFKSQYDPDILAKIRQYGGSEAYPNYTRSKVKPTISKINQIFFPIINKAWEIVVDKTQKVPTFIIKNVMEEVNQLTQQGIQVDTNKVKQIIQNKMNNLKDQVENEISEQLTEMKFEEMFKATNYSAVLYGTGILKGILTRTRQVNNIYYDGENIIQNEETEYEPYVEYIPIWDIYPDTSTYDADKISYVFQRHKMSKKDLINLSKFEGFDETTIMNFIKEHPDGNYIKPNWEVELEGLSTEKVKSTSITGQYVVLEYWGYIDGHLLDEDKYNPKKAYMANVWLLGNKVIKLETFPLETPNSIYHFYYYEKDDSSIFGTGLPKILRGTQLAICGAARMILDNATSVVGDQLEVNVDLLVEGQDISTQYPRKIWYREGRGQEAQYPAIRSISGNSHIPEYATIINIFKQFGDEESNLPAFVWGNPDNLPANTTATGFTQLSANTNMSIADIVRGYEKENIKILKELIEWNANYNDRLKEAFSIKYIVKGFGYESQVYKEKMLSSLAQFNNSIPPQDEIYINKYNLYKHEVKLLGLPYEDIIKSPEEVQQEIAQQQDPELNQLTKEELAANVEYTKAKATHMLAKSKSTLDKDLLGGNK